MIKPWFIDVNRKITQCLPLLTEGPLEDHINRRGHVVAHPPLLTSLGACILHLGQVATVFGGQLQ